MNSKVRILFLILCQLSLLLVSTMLAVQMRSMLPIGVPLPQPGGMNTLIACAVVLYPLSFLVLSLYDVDRTFRAVDEFQILTVASLTAGVLTAFFVFFFAPQTSRLLLAYFYGLEYISLFSLHSVRRLLARGSHGPDPRTRSPLNGYQRTVKRLVDIVFGCILLVLVSPVLLVISLAIALNSRGPVFFRQIRVGENGRLFRIVKFRTMSLDAESRLHEVIRTTDDGQIIHKHNDDPRVTQIGRLLRRTSLDELPQLFNVVVGEMSLVGPRPELPMLVERYEPWQRERLTVPQGMTGWWQVNGRSDKPMHLNTQDDLYYVRNYSLLLDLLILLKTVWVVLRGKGAY